MHTMLWKDVPTDARVRLVDEPETGWWTKVNTVHAQRGNVAVAMFPRDRVEVRGACEHPSGHSPARGMRLSEWLFHNQ